MDETRSDDEVELRSVDFKTFVKIASVHNVFTTAKDVSDESMMDKMSSRSDEDDTSDVVLDDEMPPSDFNQFVKKASMAQVLVAQGKSGVGTTPAKSAYALGHCSVDSIQATIAYEDGSSDSSSSDSSSSDSSSEEEGGDESNCNASESREAENLERFENFMKRVSNKSPTAAEAAANETFQRLEEVAFKAKPPTAAAASRTHSYRNVVASSLSPRGKGGPGGGGGVPSPPGGVITAPGLLPHTLSGLTPAPGTPVLVFLPGFPDDCGSFEAVAAQFRTSHTVVQACWPGYEAKHPSPGGGTLGQRFGHSFNEVAGRCAATIEAVTAAANGTAAAAAPPQRVTLVAHDWGAYLAYLLCAKRPELVRSGGVVALDVGLMDPWQLWTRTPFSALVIIGYQLWLVLCFLASQLVHTLLGDALMALYPWTLAGPCPYEHALPRDLREVHSWMGYPYFNLWVRSLWTGGPPKLAFPPIRGVPLLYCFGARKRVLFHTPHFLRLLDDAQRQPGGTGSRTGGGGREGGKRAAAAAGAVSRWVAFPECGHWLHTQQPDRVAREIRAFMAAVSE